MKTAIRILLIFCFLTAFAVKLYAAEITPVTSSVYYSQTKNIWSPTAKSKSYDRITKRANKFFYKGKYAFTLESTALLIVKKQAIVVNENNLTFYRLYILNDQLMYSRLSPDNVAHYFTEINVIPVSDFTKGSVIIKRQPFSNETYMIVNDTNLYFQNYDIFPATLRNNLLKGMFNAKLCGTIKYAHINDLTRRNAILRITIKRDIQNQQEQNNKNKKHYIKKTKAVIKTK